MPKGNLVTIARQTTRQAVDVPQVTQVKDLTDGQKPTARNQVWGSPIGTLEYDKAGRGIYKYQKSGKCKIPKCNLMFMGRLS